MITPERLGLEIKVGANATLTIQEAKREMAVLANRLGITVHAELNDELCLACPGEDIARVYGKKRSPQPCQHESLAANGRGSPPVPPLLNPDQVAVMRHALQAGLRSVPVFARAFGLTFSEIEKVMGEISSQAELESVAVQIAAWIDDNPHGNSGVEMTMLADDIRDGAWKE